MQRIDGFEDRFFAPPGASTKRSLIASCLIAIVLGLALAPAARSQEGEKEKEKESEAPAVPDAPDTPDTPAEPNPEDEAKAAVRIADPYGDELPDGAIMRLGSDRLRHASDVFSLSFMQGHDQVISFGFDSAVRVWDTKTGKEVRRLDVQSNAPSTSKFHAQAGTLMEGLGVLDRAVENMQRRAYARFAQPLLTGALSPDGKTAACASDSGNIFVFTVEDMVERHRISVQADTELNTVVYSPDGALIAFGGAEGLLGLQAMDFASSPRLLSNDGEFDVEEVEFLPGGTLLAAACGPTITIYDIEKGAPVHTLTLPPDDEAYALCMVISSDGKRLYAGDDTGKLNVFDLESQALLEVLSGHEDNVLAVTISPDGEMLLSGDASGTIFFWNRETLENVASVKSTGPVHDLSYSADGAMLGAAHTQIVRLWEVETGMESLPIDRHHSDVTDVEFTPDGQRLATSSGDESVRVWEVATGKSLQRWTGYPDRIDGLSFSVDGKQLVTASWHIDAFGMDDLEYDKTITIEGSEVHNIDLSLDGKRALIVQGAAVSVIDMESGEVLFTDEEHEEPINHSIYSPDGKTIATGSDDRTIRLLAAEDGKQILAITSLKEMVSGLAFSPDGKTLAAAGGTKKVWIIDVTSGKTVAELPYKGTVIYDLTFSDDGKLLAGGNALGELMIWDVAAATEIAHRRVHSSDVLAVDFTPDGKLLASASLDTTILIWEVEKLK